MFFNGFDRYTQMSAFKMHQDKGRSMVEIIAVLSLIGILSIGGVYGFDYAVQSYKNGESVNEIALSIQAAKGLQVVEKYGSEDNTYIVPVKELLTSVDYVSASSDDNSTKAYLTRSQTPVWVRVEDENGFTVNISGISQDMCRKVIATTPGFFAAFKGEAKLDATKATLDNMVNKTYPDSTVYHASDLEKNSQNVETLCGSIAKQNTLRSQASIYREHIASSDTQLTLDSLLDTNVAEKANVDMSPLVLYFKTTQGVGERPIDKIICSKDKKGYDSNGQFSRVCCGQAGGRAINGVCCALKDDNELTGKDLNGVDHDVCRRPAPAGLCKEPGSALSKDGELDAWCCASDPDGAHGVWVPKKGSTDLDANSGTCCSGGFEIEERNTPKSGSKTPACCKMQKQRGKYVPTPFEAGTNILTEDCCEAAGYIWNKEAGVCCDGKYQVDASTGVVVANNTDSVTDACCKVYGEKLKKYKDCKVGPQESPGTCCCKMIRVTSDTHVGADGSCPMPNNR